MSVASRYFYTPLPTFVRLHARINQFTGMFVDLVPAIEIHHEDLDWLERLWDESDRLDYELWRAGAS